MSLYFIVVDAEFFVWVIFRVEYEVVTKGVVVVELLGEFGLFKTEIECAGQDDEPKSDDYEAKEDDYCHKELPNFAHETATTSFDELVELCFCHIIRN